MQSTRKFVLLRQLYNSGSPYFNQVLRAVLAWDELKFMALKEIMTKPLPSGYRWIKCRYRRVRAKAGTPESERRVLDAHAYGYKCWSFAVRSKS